MARQNEYRVVVVVPINGVDVYLDLDTCTARSVKSNARVAKYPIENGVEAADHMYREATKLEMSGSFSLNSRATAEGYGKYDQDTLMSAINSPDEASWNVFFENEGASLAKAIDSSDRLTRVQSVFEWIQANGVRCSIMFMSGGDGSSGNMRFKRRDQMVLESITWAESLNSMTYSFGWVEVITVGSLMDSFEVLQFDDLYPAVAMPSTKSVGQVLQESGDLSKQICMALLENGYISKADAKALVLKGDVDLRTSVVEVFAEEFYGLNGLLTSLVTTLGGALIAIGVAVKVGIGAVIAGTLSLSALLGPAAVVGIAVGAIVGFGIIIAKTFSERERRHRLESGFNLIYGYEQYVDTKTLEPKNNTNVANAQYNKKDLGRLRVLIDDVVTYFDQEFGDRLSFYQIEAGTDNNSRDFILLVGSDYLTVRITRAGDDAVGMPRFSMSLFGGTSSDSDPITPLFGTWPVCTSFDQMSRGSNVVYISKDRQYELYLYNPSLDSSLKATDKVTSECYNLSAYSFIISHGSVEENVEKLHKTLLNALDKYGFES